MFYVLGLWGLGVGGELVKTRSGQAGGGEGFGLVYHMEPCESIKILPPKSENLTRFYSPFTGFDPPFCLLRGAPAPSRHSGDTYRALKSWMHKVLSLAV